MMLRGFVICAKGGASSSGRAVVFIVGLEVGVEVGTTSLCDLRVRGRVRLYLRCRMNANVVDVKHITLQ